MVVYNKLLELKQQQASYFCLIDPDSYKKGDSAKLAALCEENGADGILVGGSMMFNDSFTEHLKEIKAAVSKIPVIIFPGLFNFVSSYADALFLLSMLSSRNPQLLIGEQVRAAPVIRKCGLETIGTAYLLIDGNVLSSVQYMSHSLPIPWDKDDIAAIHALAAEYMGFRIVYMDSGSGAEKAISDSMIRKVREEVTVPLVVGGGIRLPETARSKAEAGADFIVTGNILEKNNSPQIIKEFADAIHSVKRND